MMRAVFLSLAIILGVALSGAGTPVFAQNGLSIGQSTAPRQAITTTLSDAQGKVPDFEKWTRTAKRAEAAIDAERASDSALQRLREELVQWRATFTDARSINSNRIDAVQAQLDALGPVPENGQEPEEITEQRKQLSAQLAELQAPGKTAQVALSRVNVLINSIDQIVSQRQAAALLNRGPTPLNPGIWLDGVAALSESVAKTGAALATAWHNPNQRAAFNNALPLVLVMGVIGLLLMVLGRRWTVRLCQRVLKNRVTPLRWLVAFLFSLGQVVLPIIGLLMLVGAAFQTGLVGLRTDPLLRALAGGGATFFVAMWLGGRIFPKAGLSEDQATLTPLQLRFGRTIAGLIGLVIAARHVIETLGQFDGWSPAAEAVIFFPLFIVGGILIWQSGVLLRRHNQGLEAQADPESETPGYSARVSFVIGRTLAIAAFVGPALAAVGYFEAALRFTFPLLATLLLLAFVIVLQRVMAELYVLIRRHEEARDGLVPVLAGLLLFLAALPFLAVLWGVSTNQLQDYWQRAAQGVRLGDTTISPTVFLTFVVVFIVGFMATRLLQGVLKASVLPKTKMDIGAQSALISGIGYVGIFLAALIAITSAGVDLTALGYVAGALSVGIGFGLQNIVSNFVSGIILLIERPISQGDWIEVNGTHGTVRDISVRSTRVETFDRSDVILPNADLITGTVTNYTRGNTVGRAVLSVGVAYTSDTHKVEKILLDIASAHPMVSLKPAPSVVFVGIGAESFNFDIRVILRDVNFIMTVKSELYHEIVARFAAEGIEMPYTTRDIWLRNPETLPGATPRNDAAPALTQDQPDKTDDLPDYDDASGEGDADK
jgi:small-conductance mechanosensitive channel